MNLLLTRQSLTTECALGQLTIDGRQFFTIEQPWANNLPDHSCIPPGTYQLVPHSTVTHPDTWAMVNPELFVYHEPDDIPAGEQARAACLIHSANWAFQLKGCIAPGGSLIDSAQGKMVTSSQIAMGRIRAILGVGTTGHTLTITQPDD